MGLQPSRSDEQHHGLCHHSRATIPPCCGGEADRDRGLSGPRPHGRKCGLRLENQDEFDMFGVENRPHDQRYAYAREWLQVIRQLWKSEREFDFHGKFIDLRGLISNPKPYGGTRPLIMNAGASTVGRDFALEHSDVLFSLLVAPEQSAKAVAEARARAHHLNRDEIEDLLHVRLLCVSAHAKGSRRVSSILCRRDGRL